MKTLDDIVNRYYEVILEYERYLEKYQNKNEKNSYDSQNEDLFKIFNNTIKSIYEKDYMPWRNIKGDIKEELKKDFMNRNKLIPYLKAEDAIYDNLFSLIEKDLFSYYSKKGFNINEDDMKIKINEEACDYCLGVSLDLNKFSEESLCLKKILNKLKDVCGDIYKIYNGEYVFDNNEGEIEIDELR